MILTRAKLSKLVSTLYYYRYFHDVVEFRFEVDLIPRDDHILRGGSPGVGERTVRRSVNRSVRSVVSIVFLVPNL